MSEDMQQSNLGGIRVAYPNRPSVPFVYVCMVIVVLFANVILYRGLDIGPTSDLLDAPAQELKRTSISVLKFEIESDPTKTDSGYLVQARTTLPSGVSTVVWLSSTTEYQLGTIVSCVGRFYINDETDWGQSNRARGIAGRVHVVREITCSQITGSKAALIWVRSSILSIINPAKSEARALLAGVLVGRRTELKIFGLDEVFANAGLSHLIAVSGSHLAIVATLLEMLMCSFGISHKHSTISVLVISALYVCICACPASAVRSWIMLALARLSVFAGRRAHNLTALGIAGIIMVAQNLYCAADLGFLLSMLSVSALSLYSDYMQAFATNLMPKAPIMRLPILGHFLPLLKKSMREVKASFVASLVCQVATMFVCGVAFNRLSLVAPFANVVVGTLFAPLVGLGTLGSLLSCLPGIGAVFLLPAQALSWLVVTLTKLLASVPFSSLIVAFPKVAELIPLVAGVLLYLCWPEPSSGSLRFGLVGICFAIGCYVLCTCVWVAPQIVVLDVGQGDAILLREGTHSILIDTGPYGELTEALARNHILYLDAIFLTHLHDDHIGGLEELVGNVGVGNVYVSQGVLECMSSEALEYVEELTGRAPQEVSYETQFSLGRFEASCLWPKSLVTGENNEDSLCTLIRYESFVMLCTGDAESDVLLEIDDEAGDIDVLKLGHHGSKISVNAEALSVLKPEVSIASAGMYNSYGHPTQECIDAVIAAGSRFLCTKDAGDIYLFPDAPARVVCAQ